MQINFMFKLRSHSQNVSFCICQVFQLHSFNLKSETLIVLRISDKEYSSSPFKCAHVFYRNRKRWRERKKKYIFFIFKQIEEGTRW